MRKPTFLYVTYIATTPAKVCGGPESLGSPVQSRTAARMSG